MWSFYHGKKIKRLENNIQKLICGLLMSNATIVGFSKFKYIFLIMKNLFWIVINQIKDEFGDSERSIAILNITIKLKQSKGQWYNDIADLCLRIKELKAHIQSFMAYITLSIVAH